MSADDSEASQVTLRRTRTSSRTPVDWSRSDHAGGGGRSIGLHLHRSTPFPIRSSAISLIDGPPIGEGPGPIDAILCLSSSFALTSGGNERPRSRAEIIAPSGHGTVALMLLYSHAVCREIGLALGSQYVAIRCRTFGGLVPASSGDHGSWQPMDLSMVTGKLSCRGQRRWVTGTTSGVGGV